MSTRPATLRRRIAPLLRDPRSRALSRAAGEVPCHLVGGALRDAALGLAVRDLDAVVARGGRRIAEELSRTLGARLVDLGGEAFASFRLVAPGFTLDLWDRRDASLRADLARRDLTVNAIALALDTGRLIDPFGGLDDLERRLLRAVRDDSFRGDALRVVRLARLAAVLPGFAVEGHTRGLAAAAAERLLDLPAERVRQELELLLGLPELRPAIELLADLHVYPGLWLGSPGRAGAAEAALRSLAALPGLVERMGELLDALPWTVDRAACRLALLVAGLAPDSPDRAAGALGALRRRGLLSGVAARRVAPLLADARLPEDDAERRWFLHRAGDLWPSALCVVGARRGDAPRGRAWAGAARALRRLAAGAALEIFDPPPLLRGDEAAEALGIRPGPRLGAALADLRRAQIEGRVRGRRQAIARLRRAVRRSSDAD